MVKKTKTQWVPENSIGFLISFKSLEERDHFIDSEVFKELAGMANVSAIKNKGRLVNFSNP